ncbi:MAG: DUF2783 domain-containing protein [Alphaproteobacteria bacterium]|nr:DUF2783 domain-containing protein [Alphaproteobacteria bacterium]
MTTNPNEANLEDFYNGLALAIDAVGPQKESLLLCKLALLLAQELGRPERAFELIAQAQAD